MILLGTIFDRQDETLISNFEFETRLPNNLKLEFEGRFSQMCMEIMSFTLLGMMIL